MRRLGLAGLATLLLLALAGGPAQAQMGYSAVFAIEEVRAASAGTPGGEPVQMAVTWSYSFSDAESRAVATEPEVELTWTVPACNVPDAVADGPGRETIVLEPLRNQFTGVTGFQILLPEGAATNRTVSCTFSGQVGPAGFFVRETPEASRDGAFFVPAPEPLAAPAVQAAPGLPALGSLALVGLALLIRRRSTP